MTARVHRQSAQRASTGDCKAVFKGVLDNPFKVSWPYVPLNLQNTALASLVTILAGVADYYTTRHSASRKRKRARYDKARKDKASVVKKRKVNHEGTGVNGLNNEDAVAAPPDPPGAESAQMDLDADADELPAAPPIFSHLTVGINQVTKRLESQANSRRVGSSIRAPSIPEVAEEPASAPAPEAEHPPLTHVFVCRADVDPPLLIAHLPELVAACNIPSPTLSQNHTPVQLIPLPKHAEYTLTEAVGLRRVSVLAFDSTTPSLATLSSLLSSVQPPSAPWLTAPAPSRPLPHVPTHIKQLRTTAPNDIRMAKRARTEGRQTAKKRSKEKQAKIDASEEGKEKRKTVEYHKKRIRISARSYNHLPT